MVPQEGVPMHAKSMQARLPVDLSHSLNTPRCWRQWRKDCSAAKVFSFDEI